MTQLQMARQGQISPEMAAVAAAEAMAPEAVAQGVAEGKIVIPRNRGGRKLTPCGIGAGLRTKINVNLGTSPLRCDLALEWQKIALCHHYRVDTLMDLSTGGNLTEILAETLRRAEIPVGTVPLYGAVQQIESAGRPLAALGPDEIFAAIEAQAELGVDFITVHCGVTRASLEELRRQPRLCGIVSRGGSLLAHWIRETGRENPLYEQFDRLLALAARHDLTLSLGDGLRPGAVADATDAAQLAELNILGQLTLRCREAGVQCMIEGPGHVPLNDVARNMKLQKELCHGAPFYVLGPLVTDVAPGYDHITAAIGGAWAGASGADYLCYVTPAEHLRLPDLEDVRQGIVAFKLAAHAADLAKGLPGAAAWDRQMSLARQRLDWGEQERLAIDPERVRQMLGDRQPARGQGCSMCGSFCAFKHQGGV